MRIGYCSPFNPMKSGISDFSEELVFALARHLDVVIFSPVTPSNEALLAAFEVHALSELDNPKIRESLDEIVYHVGNNALCHGDILKMLDKYPGIVELHDFGIHNMVGALYSKSLMNGNGDDYIRMAEYCHGESGKRIAEDFVRARTAAPWELYPLEMSMNRPVLEKATAVIVHSEFAKQMVLGLFPTTTTTTTTIHHSMDLLLEPAQWKAECRRRLQMQEGRLIFGSFGHATPAKRIVPILDALKEFRKVNSKFLYVIAGDAAAGFPIKSEVASRNLEENVLITGFVSLEEFKLYMGACDFCLNLRYPTQGENSGSLHRMLGMGKPVVVTDIGTFADYPDDVAWKVRHDEREVSDIYRAILILSKNKNELKRRGKAALEYAKTYCDIEKNAIQYAEFFRQVHERTWQPEYEDVVIARLCELGLTDEEYTSSLYRKVEVVIG